MRTYEDITAEERKLLTLLLTNHSTDLMKEAKKLREDLGQDSVANKLTRDAQRITRELKPIFDDQGSFDLDEARNGKKKEERSRNRGLMIGPGAGDSGGARGSS